MTRRADATPLAETFLRPQPGRCTLLRRPAYNEVLTPRAGRLIPSCPAILRSLLDPSGNLP